MKVITRALYSLAVLVGLAAIVPLHAQSGRAAAPLTDQDRSEIQDLVTRYARALAGCAAEDYADVFVPGDGYFFSSLRGEVKGREHLMLLVQSERQCNPPTATTTTGATGGRAAGPNANASGRTSNGPVVVIEPSPEGATGKAALGNAGGYEDVYVKTPKGWRIKARTVITPPEAGANLTAQDFIDIRRLAGNDRGQFDDVYVDAPGGKRYRSSGVALSLVPDGVKGMAYLHNDGGHYEDVYVKAANGWRFKSRLYVPPADTQK